MIWGMAKPKGKLAKDNFKLKAAVEALEKVGVTQVQIATAIGITTDKLNKSIHNKRRISVPEHEAFEAFLKIMRQRFPNLYQAELPENGHNAPAASSSVHSKQEPPAMIKDSGLSDEVAKDLLTRVRRIEQKLEEMGDSASKSPQKGRKQ